MAEVLGIVSSVISIAQAAKWCLEMYGFVSDAKNSNKDVDKLLSQLRLEKAVFRLWCEEIGLEKVMAIEGIQFQSQADNRDLEEEARRYVPPEMQRGFVLEAIAGVIGNILRAFSESDGRFKRYSHAQRPPKSPALCPAAILEPNGIELADRASSSVSSRSKMLAVAIMWAASDKKKLKSLLKELRAQNQALKDVLSLTDRARFVRHFEMLATTTLVAVSLLADPEEEDVDPPEDYQDAKRLMEISRLNSRIDRWSATSTLFSKDEIEENAEKVEEETRASRANDTEQVFLGLPPLGRIPMPQLYLLSSDMSLINPSPTGLKAAGRTLGTYQGQPIIVEWKHYSTKIPPALLSNLKRRVDMLTLQLQRSSQTAGFSVLPCVGHFDDEPRHRIGIVFERPDNTTPISLRERMAQDRRSNRVRELGQRFNVAKTIVLAIYRMHSVGWLHKSMLSENILFSESVNEDALHLSTPFLCGFDFSRPDAPNEMTERIPSIMIQVYNDQERSLYRHPDLDYKHSAEDPTKLKPRSTRYRKEYDIYSLGIILLEIGLWYPIKDLSKKDQTLEEFRQRLLEKYLPELRYRMGDRYFNVVHKCLCGGFGNESSEIAVSEGSSTEEEYICEYEQSQKFIEAFARDAVEELEKCEV